MPRTVRCPRHSAAVPVEPLRGAQKSGDVGWTLWTSAPDSPAADPVRARCWHAGNGVHARPGRSASYPMPHPSPRPCAGVHRCPLRSPARARRGGCRDRPGM